MTKLSKRVSREATKPYGHYQCPIIITLAPGGVSDDMIGMRLKGKRTQYVARVDDVYRLLALWHAGQERAAKQKARRAGIPWRAARKSFLAAHKI